VAFPNKKKKYRSPVEGPLRRLPGQSIRDERDRLFEDKVVGYLLAFMVMWLVDRFAAQSAIRDIRCRYRHRLLRVSNMAHLPGVQKSELG
jgi:hypothetical protein